MVRSKKEARPRHARTEGSRLPSIPILGGHVNYLRPQQVRERPGRERKSWSLRVNHHQRSGSPFTRHSRGIKQRAKYLAAKKWKRAKTAGRALLEKAKRSSQKFRKAIEKLRGCDCRATDETSSSKTEQPRSARDSRRQPSRNKSIRRGRGIINRLAEKTKQASRPIGQRREDLRYAISTSTKLASIRAKADVLRNNARKKCIREKKSIVQRIEKAAAKVETKVLEETGIQMDLAKVCERLGSSREFTEGIKARVNQTERNAGGGKDVLRTTKDEARLWGPRVAPAPEKRWKI